MVALLAGVVVAAQACGGQQPAPPAAASVAAVSEPPLAIPSLTPAERERARELFMGDPRVRALLGDRPYTIEEVGVWHTPNGLRKIGAGLSVTLSEPATLEGEWPSLVYDPLERAFPPYETYLVRYRADGVAELLVRVDLDRGEVVWVDASGPEVRRSRFEAPGAEPLVVGGTGEQRALVRELLPAGTPVDLAVLEARVPEAFGKPSDPPDATWLSIVVQAGADPQGALTAARALVEACRNASGERGLPLLAGWSLLVSHPDGRLEKGGAWPLD